MKAKEFIQDLQIIEPTELKFRIKVKSKNSLLTHDIEVKSLFELMEMYANKNSLKERSNKIDLLEQYSLFLEKHGYMDTDWRAEEPFAIDEFLKKH